MNYDLEERLAKFAENVIELMKEVPENAINKRLISQVVASSGSAGANYCEANAGESKKDFRHKVAVAKKELRETKHWLRLLSKANSDFKKEIRLLYKENHELLLIFSKIISSCKEKE